MLDSHRRFIRKSLFILSGVLFLLIAIFLTPAAADTSITFGETVSGSIEAIGQIERYSFAAAAGDRIMVYISTTGSLDPRIRLFDPSGTYLYTAQNSSPGAAQILTNPLPATGNYTVLAEDSGVNETGDYRIFLQRTNHPGLAVPIGFGETISASIATDGELDTYTFNVLEGDAVMLRMATNDPSTVDPQFRIYNPDGALLNSKIRTSPGALEMTSAPLPATGVYTVLVQDYINNEAGDYTFQLFQVTGASGKLAVRPTQGLNSAGITGGPFLPTGIDYTIENTGTDPIDWSLTKSQDWLNLSKSGGTLAAGGTDTVTISFESLNSNFIVFRQSQQLYSIQRKPDVK